MINYSENSLFSESIRNCLSFDPEEYVISSIISNSNYKQGLILHKSNFTSNKQINNTNCKMSYSEDPILLKLSYILANKDNLIKEKREKLDSSMKAIKTKYYYCLDNKCFDFKLNQIPITQLNYLNTCECVRNCFTNEYSVSELSKIEI